MRHGLEPRRDGVGQRRPARHRGRVFSIDRLDDDVGCFVLGEALGEAQKIAEEFHVRIEQLVLIRRDIELPRRESRAQCHNRAGDPQHAPRMIHHVQHADQKWTVDETHSFSEE